MNYEIVNLEEKIIVGLSEVTSNNDPNMTEIIGELWSRFYNKEINIQVNNKVNKFAIGLYSGYKNDSYEVTVGNEVSLANNCDLVTKVIPKGLYAKFAITGNMITAVADAWNAIWKMELDRAFTSDFEEYVNNNFDNAEINIYIALK